MNDIRELRGQRLALYCFGNRLNGAYPYIISYLNPKIETDINKLNKYDYVLFSWSYCWQDIGWVDKVKIPIIIGGKHAELLNIHDKLPRLGGHIEYWTKRLDEVESPRWCKIIPNYKITLRLNPYCEWLMVYSGDGCYWRKCTFCNVDYPYPYTQFQPEYVAEVIKLANSYGKIAGLSGESHTVAWLRAVESYLSPNNRYDVYCRADQEGWQDLHNANKIFIGLEYLSDSVLRRVKKGVSAQQIMETILEIQSLGINVESTVIIDLWETEDEREEHYGNIRKLLLETRRAGLYSGQFSLLETRLTAKDKMLYYLKNGEVIR